jgi:hypothetical protein
VPTLRLLVIGTALLVAALLLFLRDDAGCAGATRRADEAPASSSEQHPTRTDAEAPTSMEMAIPSTDMAQERVPSASSIESDRLASFRFDDGTPASGLQLCSGRARHADVLEIRREDVRWTQRLSAKGEIRATDLMTLGQIVAVRTCDSGVELVPVDLTSEHVLTTVVDAAFVPDVAPDRRGPWFELWIERQLGRMFRTVEDPREDPTAVPFADRFAPRVKDLSKPLAVAALRIVLASEAPRATAKLPRGRYHLRALSCPVGWWIDDQAIDVQAGAVTLPVRRVPVVSLRLHRDREGKVIVPHEVRIRFERTPTPEDGFSSAEVAVASEVEGDLLRVGLSYRVKDDAEYRYALLFDWGDGTSTSTAPGPWEDMLGAIDTGWAEPGR